MAGPSRNDRLGGSHRQDESGAIAVMAAVIILAVLAATSLAVDVGRTAFVSRDLQGVTDRAALDSVTAVNAAADVGITTLSGLHDEVEVAVGDSLTRNPGTSEGTAAGRQVTLLELGRVVDGSFEAMCNEPYDPAVPANCAADLSGAWTVADVTAVRVATESFVPFVFAIGEEGRDVTRTAVAESMSLASITVGSELAGVEGGLLEDVLNDTICNIAVNAGESSCNLDISAVGYQGLATTDITVGSLVEELSTVVGSPDAVLTGDVTAAEFITAAANVLDSQGRTDQAQVLRDIVLELPTDQLDGVNLLDLVDLSTTTPDRAADATINVLEVVRGSLQVANGTNLIALPDLGVTVPGVGTIDGSLTVIEAPSTAVGPVGDGTITRAHTGQVQADIDSEVTLDLVDPLTSALSALSLGSVDVTMEDVELSLGAEAAGATARLTGITCDASAEPDTTVHTATDVARLVVGDLDPATGAASSADLTSLTIELSGGLLGLPLLRVQADVDVLAELPLGGTSDTPPGHVFDDSMHVPHEDPDEPQLTYPRGHVPHGGSILETGDLDATTIDLDVSATSVDVLGILPLPVGDLVDALLGTVETTLLDSLMPVITDVVATVVDPMLVSLGVGLGNADTWANWAHCQGRELAWIDPDA